jgi:hypothetical protein
MQQIKDIFLLRHEVEESWHNTGARAGRAVRVAQEKRGSEFLDPIAND